MTEEKRLGPVDRNPRLTSANLTILLLVLATVPSIATIGLFYMMPGTKEGQLRVSFAIHGMPSKDYFQKPADQRKPITRPVIVLKNLSDQEWQNFNIEINGRFEVRDHFRKVKPGEIINFDLHQFTEKRTSSRFKPTLQPINHVRIFAKVGKSSRESWTRKITWDDYGKEITNDPDSESSSKTQNGSQH